MGETNPAQDGQRLLRTLTTIVWLAAGFTPIHLAVYAITKLHDALELAGVSVLAMLLAAGCRPMARRGQIAASASVLCVGLLAVIGLLWGIVPWAQTFIATGALLPPAIALSYVRGRLLTAVIATSMVEFTGATLHEALHPTPIDIPLIARLSMTCLAPIAVATLIVLLIRQIAERQSAMLAQARDANARLGALAETNSRLFESAQAELAARKLATEQLIQAEQQLRQAQKMEAVGKLAGGIAHDFNNLLSIVLSYASLLLNRLGSGDPIRSPIEEIKLAGERAADLTKQLLAFSRQQVIEPKIVDLNEVVAGTNAMIRRLIGEDIELRTLLSPTLGRVKADPGHLQQVIMNLVINARDAMPVGGTLTVETSNVLLDEAYAREHLGVTPGPHVMLAVSDSGTGMDELTRSRVFEPFFTTKEHGKGTGLGLSTAFGIVKQSGGSIWVYSELGQGSVFKVYLPQTEEATAKPLAPVAVTTLHGSETILLVEDQDQLRIVARDVLESYGYRVFESRHGLDALHFVEERAGKIDLLLTDVVMPQMSGRELARRVVSLRPSLRVLYMSGYTPDAIVQHRVLEPGVSLLQKPITPDALLRKVREVLDAPISTLDSRRHA
ncbi:MAG TPA: ATP-binding protein [Polyangiales bacterium]|nr:ATP-binding protein [Polyangiales bacterium]